MSISLRYIFALVLLIFIIPQSFCISFASIKAFFKKKEIVIPVDKIGIIKLTGKITAEMSEKIVKKVESFGQDSSIKGILLIVNSTGGSAAASELLFREIKELAKVKPVLSFAVVDCSSGAYQIATAGNWIIALATSSVGSIGCTHTIERHKNAHIKNGDYEADADYEIIKAGKFKTTYHPNASAITVEERERAQESSNDLYKIFYSMIATQRNLSIDRLTEWADGKSFNGEQALYLGLIDQIGGYTDAVKKLRELIEKTGIKLKEKLTFVE